jgi:hypothetical protein
MSCHQTEEYNEYTQEKTNDKLIELLTTHQRCEELLELACYQFCRNRKELLTYTEKDEVKEYASNDVKENIKDILSPTNLSKIQIAILQTEEEREKRREETGRMMVLASKERMIAENKSLSQTQPF